MQPRLARGYKGHDIKDATNYALELLTMLLSGGQNFSVLQQEEWLAKVNAKLSWGDNAKLDAESFRGAFERGGTDVDFRLRWLPEHRCSSIQAKSCLSAC